MKYIDAILALNWRDIATRAAWTFLQAFLAVILVAGESIIDLLFNADWTQLWTLFIATILAAVAAGLSALKTLIVEIIRQIRL
jgi:hypothetical protein